MKFNMIKDIDSFKNDIMLGLSGRDILFCGGALVFGGVTYFVLQSQIGEDAASLASTIVAVPFGLCGLYKPNGMPFTEYIKEYYEQKIKNTTLTYKSYDVDLLGDNMAKSAVRESGDSTKKGIIDKFVDMLLANKKKGEED